MIDWADSYIPLIITAITTYLSILYIPVLTNGYIEADVFNGYFVMAIWFIETFILYFVFAILEYVWQRIKS